MPRGGKKGKKAEKKQGSSSFNRAAAAAKPESAATQEARQRVAEFYAKQAEEGANLHPNWRSTIEVKYDAAVRQRKKEAAEEAEARILAYTKRKLRHEEAMAPPDKMIERFDGHVDSQQWRPWDHPADFSQIEDASDDIPACARSDSGSGSEPYPSVASPGKPRHSVSKEQCKPSIVNGDRPAEFVKIGGGYRPSFIREAMKQFSACRLYGQSQNDSDEPRERAPFQETFNSKHVKASAASAVATSDQPLRLAQRKQEPKVPPKYRVVAKEAADRKYDLTSSSPQFHVIGHLGEYFEDVVDEVAYENRCTREEAVKHLDAAERAHFQKKDDNKHAAEIKQSTPLSQLDTLAKDVVPFSSAPVQRAPLQKNATLRSFLGERYGKSLPYCNSHGTLVVTNRDGLAYCTCDLGYGGQHCEELRGNTLCVQAQYDPTRIFTRCAAVHMF